MDSGFQRPGGRAVFPARAALRGFAIVVERLDLPVEQQRGQRQIAHEMLKAAQRGAALRQERHAAPRAVDLRVQCGKLRDFLLREIALAGCAINAKHAIDHGRRLLLPKEQRNGMPPPVRPHEEPVKWRAHEGRLRRQHARVGITLMPGLACSLGMPRWTRLISRMSSALRVMPFEAIHAPQRGIGEQ